MSAIRGVEIHEFSFEVGNLSVKSIGSMGVGNIEFAEGAKLPVSKYAIVILTDDGLRGEYVTHWVGTPASLGQARMLAPILIGKNPDHREAIYQEMKRDLRAYDRMGHGPLDIALWDLAGKMYGASVSQLLGGYRSRIPAYASTYLGQESGGGLDSLSAYSDYAADCKARGLHGFKVHGWDDGDVDREIANLIQIRSRVGDDFPLMIDPACQLRTNLDALKLGRACDELNMFWLEDPYRDGGVSAFGHRLIRDKIKTPLLVSEHVRGLEQKANFVLAGGCDMVHADPEYDMGITGAMKIVAFCEALGIDVQFHACGPAHRACISATQNTHYYELALIGPNMPNAVPPVYLCGYSDQVEDVEADGCVPVPTGVGLGVTYDWDFIAAHRTALHVID